MKALTEQDLRRFWSKVRVNAESGCWEWTAGTGQGYGSFWAQRTTSHTHRVAYEIYHGSIPEGAHILHSCDNRLCVRRDHLRAGTHQDNMRDKAVRKRQPRILGEMNASTRFDDAHVDCVFQLHALGWTQRPIARALGMSQGHVSDLLGGSRRAG